MTAHGPFHSLPDTDKQALTDQLRSGASVLHAASELGLNYGHALNYAHTLGFGHQRRSDQQALARAVTMVAAGSSLSHTPDRS